MSDLKELFSEFAKAKAEAKKLQEETPKGQALKGVKERLKENNEIGELLEVFVEKKTQPKQVVKEVIKEVVVEKVVKEDSFQQPNPPEVDTNIKSIQLKLKFLEQAIGRIAATGPGSGEVNLRYLDDVKRDTIADGRWLKYSAADKKFIFDDINPFEVVENTTEVTTSTYTVTSTDFYIGVNYAGPVTITLPASANSGRMLIIKDEDGDAETNPITVLGTVDNDAGGFIIQINNGAIQLLYRNGWRIV
jgi:hypothetical protein